MKTMRWTVSKMTYLMPTVEKYRRVKNRFAAGHTSDVERRAAEERSGSDRGLERLARQPNGKFYSFYVKGRSLRSRRKITMPARRCCR